MGDTTFNAILVLLGGMVGAGVTAFCATLAGGDRERLLRQLLAILEQALQAVDRSQPQPDWATRAREVMRTCRR